MLGAGQTFWQDAIFVLPEHFSFIEIEFIHPFVKNLPVLFSSTSMFLTYCLLTYYYILVQLRVLNFNFHYFYYQIYFFVSRSYHAGFFNTLYNKLFISIFQISYICINKYLDKGFFEYFGPFGIYKVMRFFNNNLYFMQYSLIPFSISFMFIGLIFFVWYWLFIFSLAFIILTKHLGIFLLLSLCSILFTI